MGDALRFSADELTVLAQMLGGEDFPGIERSSFSPYSTESRAVAGRAARRGLVARGVVALDSEDQVQVATHPRRLVELALDPALMVTVEHHDPQNSDIRRFFADTDLMVEHKGFLGGVSELVERPTGELFDAIVEMSHLGARPVSDSSPLKATFRELRAVRTSSFDDGSTLPEGHPLVAAIKSGCSLTLVSTIFRVEDRVEGDWIGWFDAPDAGLWQIEMDIDRGDGSEDPLLTLFAVSAGELADAIIGGLPGGDGSPKI